MNDKLEALRKEIDALDDELLQTIAKRINVVVEIGKYKKENGIALLDEERWATVLESKLSKAKLLDLPDELIRKLFDLIHEYSLKIEAADK